MFDPIFAKLKTPQRHLFFGYIMYRKSLEGSAANIVMILWVTGLLMVWIPFPPKIQHSNLWFSSVS